MRSRRTVLLTAVAGVLALLSPMAHASSAPVGDLASWRQVVLEDFNTAAPLGSFPGAAYGDRWMSYDGFGDTSGIGLYDPKRVVSVHNGYLDMYLHTENGRPLGAAPVPYIEGKWGGLLYGRYTVRFKADLMPGYGAGWLLWPDSNDWNEGEIDFPEGSFGGTIHAYNHVVGNPSVNAMSVDTLAKWNVWHTATVDWTPTAVTYYLDGRKIGASAVSPKTPMHLVLQTATTGVVPAARTAGHVLIDWVSIYRWKG